MKRVVVTGATGVLGRALVAALLARGDEVVALSRDPSRAGGALGEGVLTVAWPDPKVAPPPLEAFSGADGVVHLLGEPIAQRWSAEAKREIRASRVDSTRQLVAGLRQLPEHGRPRVLVSQSAAGYYGHRGADELDESAPPGSDFLASVVVEWEREASAAQDIMRVVLTRTGIVLTPTGGALGQMLPFFRLGIGGPVAGGKQYVPWIHLDDVVGGLLACLDDQRLQGPVNLSAPEPAPNSEFSHALGRALHRPARAPVPGFALRLLYGEMAEAVTTGQRVVPKRLLQAGYQFSHPDLDEALRALLARG